MAFASPMIEDEELGGVELVAGGEAVCSDGGKEDGQVFQGEAVIDVPGEEVFADDADDHAHGDEHGGEGQDLHFAEDLQVLLESGALFQPNFLLPKYVRTSPT